MIFVEIVLTMHYTKYLIVYVSCVVEYTTLQEIDMLEIIIRLALCDIIPYFLPASILSVSMKVRVLVWLVQWKGEHM